MNFGFTEEQALLREQVRKFLDEKCPMTKVRELMRSEDGYSPELWQQMADLGWLGLTIDPEYAGVGMGWVDLLVVLEEMGRSLFPSPFISTTLVATTLTDVASKTQQQQYLPAIATGKTIATLALLDNADNPTTDNIQLNATNTAGSFTLNGEKPFVADAGVATLFLVAFRDQGQLYLGLVEREQAGVSTTTSATMDLTKRTGSLMLKDVQLTADQVIAVSAEQIGKIFDEGGIAVTTEMVGAAESVLEMTTNYANERIQFGQLIGKYQGVKHNLAEMYVDIESFKSLVYYAAWTVDESPAERPRSVSLAKAYASDAFAKIGTDGIQLHGAIAFTEEYDMQLYMKRSKWARPTFGDADYHYERVAALTD
ncbi:MAG: acyl-CoA/acyl-ACP dehydrogenase [Pseudomonadales bacterium]|nr:acyl-CoA/acyl-ACP dehydrogenase [Pseudomonadales bacterium]